MAFWWKGSMTLPSSPPSSCPLWTGSEITRNQWWDGAPPGWASHKLASRFKGLCHHSKLRYNKGPMKVTVELLVPQSCLTLCDPMDCGPPGSSVDGILQARILEWVTIPFSSWWLRVACNWLGKLGNTTNQNFLPPSFPFCFPAFPRADD